GCASGGAASTDVFFAFSSQCPRVWPWKIKLLLDRLAFLALDVFANVTDTLAFVGFRRIKGAQFRGDFAHQHLVRPLNRQLRILLDRHFDLVGDVVINRMRVTERHVDNFALHGGLETDALDFELLDETLGHTLDHVVDERAAQAVQRLGLRVIAVAAHDDLAVGDLQAGALRQFPVEPAFRPLDQNFLPFDFHLHLWRNGNRLFSNSRHKVLPDVAEQFTAEVFLLRLLAGHHAIGRGHNRDAHAAKHARNLRGADITAQAGPAHAFEAFNHVFLALVFEADFEFLDHVALYGHVADVAFALQNLRNAFLHPRVRQFHRRQQRLAGVADAGQHVCNRIADIKIVIVTLLPTGLRHAGNQAVQRRLPERQTRNAELAEVGVAAAAKRAAVHKAHRAGVARQ